MGRRAGPSLAVLVILALTFGWLGPVWASTSSDLDGVRREIAALDQTIRGARAEATEAGRAVAAARDRLSAVLSELEDRQAEIDDLRRRIGEEQARLAALQAELSALRLALASTRSEIVAATIRLQAQAVDLYIEATSSVGISMLYLDSATEVAVSLAYAEDVSGQTEELLKGFEALRLAEERQVADVEETTAEVSVGLEQLHEEEARLGDKLAEVERLRRDAERELADARVLLDRINREIRQAEQHKEGLQADAARLEREIRARAQAAASSERPGTLAWPINGRVSSPYGYRIHPILGTRRLHTGIDIDGGTGTPIRAAGAGTVILAGAWGGYGNAVVIDHGGGLTTVYAHQSRIAVSRNGKVAKGDTIGYVGCTGYCTGPHLHFETRVNGTPVDPMRYLRG
jgi:murein DD-endopeptidase MepM/ murein hydrolase activator NlpD